MTSVDILFIIPPFHRRNGGGQIFPMGIGYIISFLEKQGFSWDIINCTELIHSCYEEDLILLKQELAKIISNFSPLVVGIGPCITTQLKALHTIACVCKNTLPNVPLFAGGPFASIEGQDEIFYNTLGIDYLIKGDGEEAVADVIKTIKCKGDIMQSPKVSYRGKSFINQVNDLNSLPFPYRPFTEKDTFSLRRKNASTCDEHMMSMIASRGCPYHCNYCVSGNITGSVVPYRRRSYENIISEMKFLRDNYKTTNIVFYDDCFFHRIYAVNEDVEAFCSLIQKENLYMHWQIEMRPDFFILLNESSALKLFEAGCIQINLGIEKMSEAGLAFLGKEGNWKGLKEKITHIRNVGIKVSATFILGGATESENDIKALVQEAKNLSLDFAHFNPLFVYPGTPLYNDLYSSTTEWVQFVLEDNLPWGEIVYENEFLSKFDLLRLIDYAYAEYYKGTPHERENMIDDRFNIKRGMTNANI